MSCFKEGGPPGRESPQQPARPQRNVPKSKWKRVKNYCLPKFMRSSSSRKVLRRKASEERIRRSRSGERPSADSGQNRRARRHAVAEDTESLNLNFYPNFNRPGDPDDSASEQISVPDMGMGQSSLGADSEDIMGDAAHNPVPVFSIVSNPTESDSSLGDSDLRRNSLPMRNGHQYPSGTRFTPGAESSTVSRSAHDDQDWEDLPANEFLRDIRRRGRVHARHAGSMHSSDISDVPTEPIPESSLPQSASYESDDESILNLADLRRIAAGVAAGVARGMVANVPQPTTSNASSLAPFDHLMPPGQNRNVSVTSQERNERVSAGDWLSRSSYSVPEGISQNAGPAQVTTSVRQLDAHTYQVTIGETDSVMRTLIAQSGTPLATFALRAALNFMPPEMAALRGGVVEESTILALSAATRESAITYEVTEENGYITTKATIPAMILYSSRVRHGPAEDASRPDTDENTDGDAEGITASSSFPQPPASDNNSSGNGDNERIVTSSSSPQPLAPDDDPSEDIVNGSTIADSVSVSSSSDDSNAESIIIGLGSPRPPVSGGNSSGGNSSESTVPGSSSPQSQASDDDPSEGSNAESIVAGSGSPQPPVFVGSSSGDNNAESIVPVPGSPQPQASDNDSSEGSNAESIVDSSGSPQPPVSVGSSSGDNNAESNVAGSGSPQPSTPVGNSPVTYEYLQAKMETWAETVSNLVKHQHPDVLDRWYLSVCNNFMQEAKELLERGRRGECIIHQDIIYKDKTLGLAVDYLARMNRVAQAGLESSMRKRTDERARLDKLRKNFNRNLPKFLEYQRQIEGPVPEQLSEVISQYERTISLIHTFSKIEQQTTEELDRGFDYNEVYPDYEERSHLMGHRLQLVRWGHCNDTNRLRFLRGYAKFIRMFCEDAREQIRARVICRADQKCFEHIGAGKYPGFTGIVAPPNSPVTETGESFRRQTGQAKSITDEQRRDIEEFWENRLSGASDCGREEESADYFRAYTARLRGAAFLSRKSGHAVKRLGPRIRFRAGGSHHQTYCALKSAHRGLHLANSRVSSAANTSTRNQVQLSNSFSSRKSVLSESTSQTLANSSDTRSKIQPASPFNNSITGVFTLGRTSEYNADTRHHIQPLSYSNRITTWQLSFSRESTMVGLQTSPEREKNTTASAVDLALPLAQLPGPALPERKKVTAASSINLNLPLDQLPGPTSPERKSPTTAPSVERELPLSSLLGPRSKIYVPAKLTLENLAYVNLINRHNEHVGMSMYKAQQRYIERLPYDLSTQPPVYRKANAVDKSKASVVNDEKPNA